MQQLVVPPAPNWYGAHLADWAPSLGLYAYAAQNSIVLLNTRAQTVRTQLAGHTNRVTAVAFAGAAASGAAASAASYPDTAAGEPLPPLLVSAAADRSLRLWHMTTLQRLRALYKRPAEVTALAVSSDGRTALLGDKAGSLFSWDLSSPSSKPVRLPGCKHSAAVTSLAAAPVHSATHLPRPRGGGGGSGGSGNEGLLLAGYADGTVLLLDWRRDRVVRRLERHAREVQCVQWNAAPDPSVAAALAARQAAAATPAASASTHGSGAADAGGSSSSAQAGQGSETARTAAAEAATPGDAVAQQEGHAGEEDVPPPPPPPPPPLLSEAAGAAASQVGAEALPLPAPTALQPAPPGAGASETAAAEAPLPAAAPAEAAGAAAAAPAGLAAPAAGGLLALPVPAAPPAWEVLLSSGADGALYLYSLALAAQPGSGSGSGSGSWGSKGDPSGVQPVLQHTLRLPRPHGGLTTSQSSRLWFAAVVVPPLPSALPAEEAAEAARNAAAGGSEPQAMPPQLAKAQLQPRPEHIWLVSTSHGGSLLGWKVPLPAQPGPRGSPGRGPAQAVTPSRLPVCHGRSVFTLHAAALAALPAALPPNTAAASSGEQQQQQRRQEEAQPQPQPQPQPQAELHLLTTSMDRCLLLSRLPHPEAAAEAALAEAPVGSWRRDSAAGAAGEAAWKQASVAWRLTGLGGHVYGLSLLLPPAALGKQQEQAQQQVHVGGQVELDVAQHAPEPAGACGSEGAQLPLPPPPSPGVLAYGQEEQAGKREEERQREEEQQREEQQHQFEGQAGQQEQQQQQRRRQAWEPADQEQKQQQQEEEPVLLAIACGDKTVRVLPLPRSSAGAEVSSGQQKQLLLWQNITGKVTAVAWQPLLSHSAGAGGSGSGSGETAAPTRAPTAGEVATEAAASADALDQAAASTVAATTVPAGPTARPGPAAAAAAAAVLAFGCEDGSLGLMLPSREQSLLLPVKHKAAVTDMRWALDIQNESSLAESPAPASALPALHLYSLSADGTMLLWGPLPQPLSDVFPVCRGSRHSGDAGSSSGGSSSSSSWAAPGSKLAAAAAVNPLDIGARLAGTQLAPGAPADATSWLTSAQPTVTAFAVQPAGTPAAQAAGRGCHLLAVAVRGGGAAVLRAVPAAAAGKELSLELLWATGGSGSPVSHLCFSADGWELASAAESGLLTAHPWAAQAGLRQQGPLPASQQLPDSAAPEPATSASVDLGSAVTALAWVGGTCEGSSSCGSGGGSNDGGGSLASGCSSGGVLAAALLSGGIQLLGFHPGSSCGDGSVGSAAGVGAVSGSWKGCSLTPTALLRGHSGIIRTLAWLPPQPDQASASPQAEEAATASVPADAAGLQQQQQPPAGQSKQEQLEEVQVQEQVQERGQGQPNKPEPKLEPEQPEELPQQQADVQQAVEQKGASAAPPRPTEQQWRHRLLLLSGAEDQSVRLWDVRRQLAAWQQRQGAAAAAAAAEVVPAAQAGSDAAAMGPIVEQQVPASGPDTAIAAATGGSSSKAVQPVAGSIEGTGGAMLAPPAELAQPPAGGEQATAAAEEVPAGRLVAAPALAAPVQAQAPAEPAAAALPVAPVLAASALHAVGAAAGGGAAGGSKKKGAGGTLGDRPLLPAALVGEEDRGQQQAAQQACLQLAQQLLQAPAQAAADEAAVRGAGVPPPPPPPPAPNPAAALPLDCVFDPLTASLVLQQQAEGLDASASTAASTASRHALAHRAAATALLRGDVGAAVQVLLQHDALTADFVSMSAAAGPAAWRAVTQAYAAKLEQQQEPHLAALHLLAAGLVEPAVQVYRRAGLLREAVTLAAARLLPGHPLLMELHASYAAHLTSRAQHEQAAAHLMAAGQWAAAAAALGSRGTAVAAAAAVQLCRQALSCPGAELPAREESRVQRQLSVAEQQLMALAASQGVDAGTALAAVVLPAPAQHTTEAAEAADADGGSGTAGALPATSSSAHGQPRRRYSAQQMLAVGSSLPPASLACLPADLASGCNSSGDSGSVSGTGSNTGSSTAGGSSSGGSIGGSNGPISVQSRRRYSAQVLLELSQPLGQAGAAELLLRQALPCELLLLHD